MPDQESQGQGGGASSELAAFGEDLRREREIRGISLKEIADATKISKRFLEALERNDHRTLPAPVFTRGFVREYARYLGLNIEEMVNRYNFAAENDDRIEKPPQFEKYPQTPVRDISPKPQPKRGIPRARVNGNFVALLVLAIALSGVAYWAIEIRHTREQEPAEVPVALAASPTKPVVPAPVPAPSPGTAVTSSAIPVLQPTTPPDDSRLRLVVEVVENTWVTLEADGRTVLNTEMMKGERRTFEAGEAFRFRTIGNAAGLRLTINDAVVPALGATGEVVKNRVFDRESLQQLRSSSSATPGIATES